MNSVSAASPSRLIPLAAALLLILPSLTGCDRASRYTVEEHIQRAEDMNAEGDVRGMVIELKNAIQRYPDNPKVRLMLGEAYLQFKLGDNAAKEFERAQSQGVSGEVINPLRGEALILTKDYQRVLDELQVTHDTKARERARILQLRGDALLGLRKPAEGCALYRDSQQADPRWHKAYTGVAACDFAQGKADEARRSLRKSIELSPRSADAWIMLSKLERSQHRPQAARVALDNAVKANKASLEALVERASLLVEMKDFKAAQKDAERLAALYPKHFMSDYVQALLAFGQKKPEVAREHIARSLQTAPGYVPSMLLAGAIEFGLGNMRTAETHLARVVQNWPRHSYALRLLAAAQLQQGDAAKAAETLAALHPDQSDDETVLILASDIALAQKDPARASRYLEKAAKLNPDSAAIRAQLGIARLGEGDDRALSDLMAASSLDPQWKGADRPLILGQIRQRDFSGALASIVALEKKIPNSAEPWNYRGVVYLAQEDFPKARAAFEQALKRDPGHFPSAANLAELDLHDKQPARAKARFESILKIDNSNLDAMLALAGLADRAGNRKEQLARLEQANKHAPQALAPLLLLSNFYLEQGDRAKALIYARQANDAHPNNVDALATLGQIQLASGEIPSALSTCTKLVELAPNSAQAQLALARAQIASKQPAAARASLLKARGLAPEDLAVQEALLQLDLAERKFDDALQIARQLQAKPSTALMGYEREGDIRVAQGQAPQAVTAYDRALSLGQSSGRVIKLLRALHFAGDNARADKEFASWLRQRPDDRGVRAFAAEYFLMTGRNRNAIAQYEYLLRQDPNRAAYLNNLATLYHREQDKRALATAERAHKLAPNAPGIQDTLGWILVEKGDITTGRKWLQKAVAGAPRAASVRYHYASALAREGNVVQARKELQQLLSAQPNFAEAAAARSLLSSL